MMNNNIILFDDDVWEDLLPITFTRPIADIRVGILTIKEKWELHLKGRGSYITQDYLSDKFPIRISNDNYVINSRLLPNKKVVELISSLELNEAFLIDDMLVAARMNKTQFDSLVSNDDIKELNGINLSKHNQHLEFISRPHHIFQRNGEEIKKDYKLLTSGKTSQPIPEGTLTVNPQEIFIEAGAKVTFATLNASKGPIYIGRDAEIMEGSNIRGPFALCESSYVKMGAKIYGDTTIGPHCKVGGEVGNSVFIGYSNKGHDGYLGNAVIGEWCNLGADTNSSNLKNNYADVRVWNYRSKRFETTESQFCGLIMGDHSKSGINTMFNTGTVVGVGSNVYGSGFPRTFIPSYAWGGASGYITHRINKMLEVAELVMTRRSVTLDPKDRIILEHIFHTTALSRNWEK